MFVITSIYDCPLTKVDEFLTEHRAFLQRYYDAGVFIASGAKKPRTGGVILANALDRNTIDKIMDEDPFCREKICVYDIVEFTPTKFASAFAPFCK